jgi:PKD repeat protein
MSLSLDSSFHWTGDVVRVKFNFYVPFGSGAASSLRFDYGDGLVSDVNPGVGDHIYMRAGNYQASITGTMLPGVNDGYCDTAVYLNFNIRQSYVQPNSWHGRDTTLLTGQTLVLRAGTPGASCTWKRSDGFILSTDSVFTTEDAGYYELTMTKDGDERTDFISVKFQAPPLGAAFLAAPDDCGLVSFSDKSYAYNNPIVKRTWYFGDGVVDSTSLNPTHQYANGGYYGAKLVVKNSVGAVDSAFQQLYIQEYPAIRLPEDTTIEKGSSLYLTDLNANTYDYTWSTGEKGYNIYVTEPGLYFVTGTTRCPSITRRDSLYVTVEDFTVHINQGAVSRCGDSKTLTAVTPANRDNYSFLWSTGDTTASIAATQSGPYTVNIRDNKGNIRRSETVYVYLTPAFQVALQPVSGTENVIEVLVEGDRVDTGYTFIWFRNFQQLELSSGQHTLQLTDTGSYQVRVTDNLQSCTSTSHPYYFYGSGYGGDVSIPDSSLTGNDSLAVSTSFTHDFNTANVFTVQLTLKDPAARETGLKPEEVINLRSLPGTSRNVSMSVSLPDTLVCATSYAVRVLSSSPADTTVWSQQFSVTNQPPQPVITQRGDSLFTSGKYNWQWYFNETPIADATSAVYRARANGAYKVESLNGNGCSSKSGPLSVVITAIDDVILNGNKIKAYPNPSEGEVYLQFEKPLLKAVAIKVYSLNGRVVYTRTTTQQLQPLDLSGLSKGFYLIEVAVDGKKKTLSLILQ